jgi:hypothetical protein
MPFFLLHCDLLTGGGSLIFSWAVRAPLLVHNEVAPHLLRNSPLVAHPP